MSLVHNFSGAENVHLGYILLNIHDLNETVFAVLSRRSIFYAYNNLD
jgi:hypothetical protein